MRFRRYYPRGSKPKYVLSDEQFLELVELKGLDKAHKEDTAHIELIPETDDEMTELFYKSCESIIKDTRYYLDNLENLPTFRVNILKIFPKKLHHL